VARTPTEDAALRRSLARAITAIRVRRGMSRSELSEAAGIPVDDLSQIEDGKRLPTSTSFSHLASALGVTAADLVAAAEAGARPKEPESVPPAPEPPAPEPSEKTARSFVLPLMGGEWEAVPGSPPTRRGTEPAIEETEPLSEDAAEDRTVVLGELMLSIATLPTDDLRRLLELARDLESD